MPKLFPAQKLTSIKQPISLNKNTGSTNSHFVLRCVLCVLMVILAFVFPLKVNSITWRF